MKSKNPYVPLDDILWKGFLALGVSYDPVPSQPALAWAVREALSRLDPYKWNTRTARKEPTCQRGHPIQEGDVYVIYHYDVAYDATIKLCLACTAMVFYLAGAHERAPVMSTHWDTEEEVGVYLNEAGQAGNAPCRKEPGCCDGACAKERMRST